jgi:hypothetical protein
MTERIIEILENSGLKEVEELKYKDGIVVARFFYDFDDDEIEAAKAYAEDECEDESEGEVWFDEFFIPYLNDIAVDNIGEIVENAAEKSGLEAQYITYDIDPDDYDYCEGIAVFYPDSEDIDIEEVLEGLELE